MHSGRGFHFEAHTAGLSMQEFEGEKKKNGRTRTRMGRMRMDGDEDERGGGRSGR